MKKALVLLLVAALAGCASNRAVLPSLEGKPRIKINAPVTTAASSTTAATLPAPTAEKFDFKFSGDIVDSLTALHAIQAQLKIAPTVGKAVPLTVKIDRKGTTIEEVLRDIGEQAGAKADVVFINPSKSDKKVFVRFNNPKE